MIGMRILITTITGVLTLGAAAPAALASWTDIDPGAGASNGWTLGLPAPALSCEIAGSNATLTLTWAAVDKAAGYIVQRATGASSTTYTAVAGTPQALHTSTTYSTTVSKNTATTYKFQVIARLGAHWLTVPTAATTRTQAITSEKTCGTAS